MGVLVMINRPSADAAAHRPGAPDFEEADPASPQLSVLDLAATRGDGVFETIAVGDGYPQALDHHLRRFASSASILDLPSPDLAVWRRAILEVVDKLGPLPEATVKAVMSRGIEGDGRPTGWVHGQQSPDHTRARTEGIAVVTLDRGLRHDVERTSPWLLAGAKTLSYAVNRAAIREAVRRGADDVIFISSDGFVLEGPTSSLVVQRGDTLLTPGIELGILDGTTLGSVFDFAAEEGLRTGYAMLTAEQLGEMDSLWLVSSGRHAAPVHTLDGVPRPFDSELNLRMNAFLSRRQE
ncbi:aminodeoxychorismate lyase [Ruicaihuangia caeni]|uniref:Aminodeoxychorismate lyase n=1 Tax=Ruicaihuangia caeni TaxID=3042517 RepID=A0AAW6T5V5_9MICO|nr:aminodeoxychorismate lyase [Klugiella sp. YN-L-19]MDI2097538.1 aminodeoxychorismate lyase [Klugiella sp. YN-L-19]